VRQRMTPELVTSVREAVQSWVKTWPFECSAAISFSNCTGAKRLGIKAIAFLRDVGFTLTGVYNLHEDKDGRALAGDFFFIMGAR
jgi:hypothetical protein